MLTSTSRVETDRAGRYLAQLCKHFARKVPAEWTDDHGTARFDWGTCVLRAHPDALTLHVEAADEESLDRVRHVVTDHLERFGARDGLRVTWSGQAP
ncbi:DUF2218 domain-containing protein [Nonomuraea pusilla]|uniref:DUF2218 domain-containing protein n=1 Tax=Nonomuraea pusilla TaxID=46177 RepID=A0A1H8E943_9ACTN|nr:DUF2218 domain-containing protein [Nonomuraea pusilla]SEN15377.1 hypothetical protein SAMN05660976_06941 [Nonomuraea pusilla]